MEAPAPAPVTSDSVAKPGSWKRSPDLTGHAEPAGPAVVPRSPFSSAAPPATIAAGGRLGGASGSCHDDDVPVETRHSGGVAADSGSSEASQLAGVHARQIIGLKPDRRAPCSAAAAPTPAALMQRSGSGSEFALPDGLSGLVESYNPGRVSDRITSVRSRPAGGVAAWDSDGGAATAQGASDPTVTVAAAAAAALNLAAERLLAAAAAGSQQRQHAGLSQGPAGPAATAAVAAHLTLQGASPSEAADRILAMVRLVPPHLVLQPLCFVYVFTIHLKSLTLVVLPHENPNDEE